MGYSFKMLPRPVSVMEFAAYRRQADELFSESERDAIVDLIAYQPLSGDLIPGSGGLRKIRIGRKGSGKRGGARVIYYFYDEDHPVLLLGVYAKNEKENLTSKETKLFAEMVARVVTLWKRK